MNYDNACKYLAEQYPAEFVRWLLAVQPQDIHPWLLWTRTNSPQALLGQVAERVARISEIEQRQNLAVFAGILAGLRFKEDLIRRFLREDMMRESVIYQDIVQKEAFRLIGRLLNRRFGEIDSSLIEQIRMLSTEQLEALGEALFDFSEVADLVAWLDQQQNG